MPFRPLNHEWLPGLISRFRDKRILVIGDLMLDEFIWGRVNRISPEAPVPIVEVYKRSHFPGGAANVARNLREFTDSVAVMGLIGDDRQGETLKALLAERQVDLAGIQVLPGYQTIVKTRIIARQQHVVRVDHEEVPPTELGFHQRALGQMAAMLPDFDAVIIEDYAKGFLDQGFVDGIGRLARESGKIVTVDPNPRNDLRWTGVTAIKPNRGEAYHAAGLPSVDGVAADEQERSLRDVARRLYEKWDTEMLLVTLGEDGMMLFQREQMETPYKVLPCPREVFDLSGAGDTAIALFTLSLAAGAKPEHAAEVANHAGSVVVGKLGTATLTAAELMASFEARTGDGRQVPV